MPSDESPDGSSFGEPPAYATPRVLFAAVLCLVGAVAQGAVGAVDLGLGLVPGFTMLILAVLDFLFGVLLLGRFIEARDAMTDPSPRVRLYDARLEAGVYLVGALLVALTLAVDLALLGAGGGGPWHLAPPVPLAAAGALLWALWRGKRGRGKGRGPDVQ